MPAPRSRLPDLEEELRQLMATTAELARRLRVTPSAVSQHLTALRDAGLVPGEHLGRPSTCT